MKPPQISDAEWEIMNLVWEKSPLTAVEIIERLGGEKKWSPKTVGTFIARLVKKGALRYKHEGKKYLYYPKVKREACIRAEGSSFLERVFCGNPRLLLAHFVKEVDLSKGELAELEKILTRKDR